MQTQIWMTNRELFKIIIKGKRVFYQDRKTREPIQMIPEDPRVKKMILTSRNRIDKKLIEQFKLTQEEQKEYDYAVKDDLYLEDRLAEICKKDCLKSGCILQKEVRE